VLRFRSLGSGSSGNATVVEAHSGATQITRLLVDCGLGLRHLDQRLDRAGLNASQIDAVFITHEHGDHIGCARQFALRHRKPVWMSQGTYAALGQPDFDGLFQPAQDGAAIDVGELLVRPFTVPHDAREPLQLTCSDGQSALGILTDLGHVTSHVIEKLAGCHALLLECNHDAQMLADSRYPAFLKQRVGGRRGHLSNAQASDALRAMKSPALRHLVAAHLSEQNNRPELARAAMSDAMGCAPSDIFVADPAWGTDWINV
jgi:phosphoribosyl 1,2-cyclic phosphodiesterase